MISATLLLLPVLANAGAGYLMAERAQSCKKACESAGKVCNVAARFALNGPAKVGPIFQDLGISCKAPPGKSTIYNSSNIPGAQVFYHNGDAYCYHGGQWDIFGCNDLPRLGHARHLCACDDVVARHWPTHEPTHNPTFPPFWPTPHPIPNPTPKPTHNPTHKPTYQPSHSPTFPPFWPTPHPVPQPTPRPTEKPTETPTENPSDDPNAIPIIPPDEMTLKYKGKYIGLDPNSAWPKIKMFRSQQHAAQFIWSGDELTIAGQGDWCAKWKGRKVPFTLSRCGTGDSSKFKLGCTRYKGVHMMTTRGDVMKVKGKKKRLRKIRWVDESAGRVLRCPCTHHLFEGVNDRKEYDANKCPKFCAEYFDGCNTCKCVGGFTSECTEKSCGVHKHATCKKWAGANAVFCTNPKETIPGTENLKPAKFVYGACANKNAVSGGDTCAAACVVGLASGSASASGSDSSSSDDSANSEQWKCTGREEWSLIGQGVVCKGMCQNNQDCLQWLGGLCLHGNPTCTNDGHCDCFSM